MRPLSGWMRDRCGPTRARRSTVVILPMCCIACTVLEGEAQHAYPDSGAFAADLYVARNSLLANCGLRLTRLLFDPLLRQVDTFGFHLHTLDIRQHAKVHAQALKELAGGIRIEQAASPCLPAAPSPETAMLLDTLRGVAELKRVYPPQAIRSYVISG